MTGGPSFHTLAMMSRTKKSVNQTLKAIVASATHLASNLVGLGVIVLRTCCVDTVPSSVKSCLSARDKVVSSQMPDLGLQGTAG